MGASPVWHERIVYGVPIRHGHTAILRIAPRPHAPRGSARLRRVFRRPGPASGRKASPRQGRRGEGDEALKASEMVPRQLCETSWSRVPFVVRLLPRSRGGCTAASPTSSSAPLPGQGRVSWRRPCRQDARRKRAPPPQRGGKSRSAGSRHGCTESVLRTRFVHAMRHLHPRKAWGCPSLPTVRLFADMYGFNRTSGGGARGSGGACTPSTAGSFTAGGLLLLNPSEAGSDRRPPQPRRFFSAVRSLPYIRQLYGNSRTAVVRLFPYTRSNEKARGGRPGLRSLQARNRTISSPIVPIAHRRHRPNQP